MALIKWLVGESIHLYCDFVRDIFNINYYKVISENGYGPLYHCDGEYIFWL